MLTLGGYHRRFVHGDARLTNIYIRNSPAEMRMIDLDWSGADGVDRYLFCPNPLLGPDRPRPDAVKCGAFMKQEHDIATFESSWTVFV